MVSGELVGWVRESEPDAVCISVVAPSSVSQARYLSSKLRASFPDLKIIVGLWGAEEKVAEASSQLRESGADDVVTTMAAAVERLAFHLPRQVQIPS